MGLNIDDGVKKDIERDKDKKDRDPEKEAEKSSEKVASMSSKQIHSIAKNILDGKDERPSVEKRDILERAIMEKESEMKQNRRDYYTALKSMNKENPSKDDLKRAVDLERSYRDAKELNERYMSIAYPNREIRQEQITRSESDRQFIKRAERETVYISPSENIIHIRQDALTKGAAPDVITKTSKVKDKRASDAKEIVLEVVKYQALTGRKIDDITRQDISRFELSKRDDRNVPKRELEKIAAGKDPTAIRTFYESGLRIGKEAPKPIEVNNTVKILQNIPRTNIGGRIEVVDRLLQGKISKETLNDDKIKKAAEEIGRVGQDKYERKEIVDKEIQRLDVRHAIDVKYELLKNPLKTNEKVVSLLLSNEKYNVQSLKEIVVMSKNMPLDKDNRTSDRTNRKTEVQEKYQLKDTELRQLIVGKNPEALLRENFIGLNIQMPNGYNIDFNKYKEALDTIRTTNEKDDRIKLAIVSDAFYRTTIDKKEGKETIQTNIIGTYAERQQIERIKNSGKESIKNIDREATKEERDKALVKAERDALKKEIEERKPDKDNINNFKPPYFTRQMGDDRVAKMVGNYLIELTSRDDYTRKIGSQRINEIRENINKEGLLIKDLYNYQRTVPDSAIVKISSKDPQLLLDLQKCGFLLNRNGGVNEEKLQNTINVMKALPADKEVERVAVFYTSLITDKNGIINIKNPVNMMDKEKNDLVKSLAVKLYAEEKNISYREPDDTVKKAKLDELKSTIDIAKEDVKLAQKNIEDLRKIPKNEELLIKDSLQENKNNYGVVIDKALTRYLNSSTYENKVSGLLEILEKGTQASKELYDKFHLDKLAKLTTPAIESANLSVMRNNCINNQGRETTIESTNRIVVLEAIRQTNDAYKETITSHLDLISSIKKDSFDKEVLNLINYVEKTCGNKDILNTPPEIIRGYFERTTFEPSISFNMKEITVDNIEKMDVTQKSAAQALFLAKNAYADEKLPVPVVIQNDGNNQSIYLSDKLEDHKKIEELYTNLINNNDINSLNRESLLEETRYSNIMEERNTHTQIYGFKESVPFDNYFKRENDAYTERLNYTRIRVSPVTTGTMIVDAKTIYDTMFDKDIYDRLKTAGIDVRVVYPHDQIKGTVEISNLHESSLVGMDDKLYDFLKENYFSKAPDDIKQYIAKMDEYRSSIENKELIAAMQPIAHTTRDCIFRIPLNKINNPDEREITAYVKAYDEWAASLRRASLELYKFDAKTELEINLKESYLAELLRYQSLISERHWLDEYTGPDPYIPVGNVYDEELTEIMERDKNIPSYEEFVEHVYNVEELITANSSMMLEIEKERFNDTEFLVPYYTDINNILKNINAELHNDIDEALLIEYDVLNEKIILYDRVGGRHEIAETELGSQSIESPSQDLNILMYNASTEIYDLKYDTIFKLEERIEIAKQSGETIDKVERLELELKEVREHKFEMELSPHKEVHEDCICTMGELFNLADIRALLPS